MFFSQFKDIKDTPIVLNDSGLLAWSKRFLASEKRYTAISGGRGGGCKTSMGAEIALRFALDKKYSNTNIICLREHANSIAESTYDTITDVIDSHNLTNYFNILNTTITSKKTGATMLFGGCQKPQKWKSVRNVSLIWGDEMENVKRSALDIICPVARSNARISRLYTPKILFTYNPLAQIDDIKAYLSDKGDELTHEHYTIYDMPESHQDKVLLKDAELDRVNNPEIFEWIWLGKPHPAYSNQPFANLTPTPLVAPPSDTTAWIDPSFIGNDTTAITVLWSDTNGLNVLGFALPFAWYELYEKFGDIIKEFNIKNCYYEKNGIGNKFSNDMYDLGYRLDPIPNTTNKVERISRAGSVVGKINLHKVDSIYNTKYNKQLKDWTPRVTKNPKFGEHDDAPDSLASLLKHLRIV